MIEKYQVYLLTDDVGRVIAIDSSAFIKSADGWLLVDEGYGDRYHHAQQHYLPKCIMDARGIFRYKMVDGQIVERSTEEMEADYIPPASTPDLAAEVAALRESNTHLQEALVLLLSGDTVEV